MRARHYARATTAHTRAVEPTPCTLHWQLHSVVVTQQQVMHAHACTKPLTSKFTCLHTNRSLNSHPHSMLQAIEPILLQAAAASHQPPLAASTPASAAGDSGGGSSRSTTAAQQQRRRYASLQELLSALQPASGNGPCTAVWTAGAIAYRCKTCAVSPSSAVSLCVCLCVCE